MFWWCVVYGYMSEIRLPDPAADDNPIWGADWIALRTKFDGSRGFQLVFGPHAASAGLVEKGESANIDISLNQERRTVIIKRETDTENRFETSELRASGVGFIEEPEVPNHECDLPASVRLSFRLNSESYSDEDPLIFSVSETTVEDGSTALELVPEGPRSEVLARGELIPSSQRVVRSDDGGPLWGAEWVALRKHSESESGFRFVFGQHAHVADIAPASKQSEIRYAVDSDPDAIFFSPAEEAAGDFDSLTFYPSEVGLQPEESGVPNHECDLPDSVREALDLDAEDYDDEDPLVFSVTELEQQSPADPPTIALIREGHQSQVLAHGQLVPPQRRAVYDADGGPLWGINWVALRKRLDGSSGFQLMFGPHAHETGLVGEYEGRLMLNYNNELGAIVATPAPEIDDGFDTTTVRRYNFDTYDGDKLTHECYLPSTLRTQLGLDFQDYDDDNPLIFSVNELPKAADDDPPAVALIPEGYQSDALIAGQIIPPEVRPVFYPPGAEEDNQYETDTQESAPDDGETAEAEADAEDEGPDDDLEASPISEQVFGSVAVAHDISTDYVASGSQLVTENIESAGDAVEDIYDPIETDDARLRFLPPGTLEESAGSLSENLTEAIELAHHREAEQIIAEAGEPDFASREADFFVTSL